MRQGEDVVLIGGSLPVRSRSTSLLKASRE